MQQVAQSIVRLMCEETSSGDEDTPCVLVRCFVTDAHSRLPRRLARLVPLDDDGDPDMQCLVLLATEGTEPQWCDPRLSSRHQVIPLVGSAMPEMFPMITRMFRQFGVPLSALVSRDVGGFVDPQERAFSIFHVEQAAGSLDIPGQDFVAQYGVSSVVAVGGPLPSGDVFAVLIFSRTPIDRRLAEMLQPLALSIKLAFLPVLQRVFTDELAVERPNANAEGQLQVEVAALRDLLAVQQRVLCDEYERLATASIAGPASVLTTREHEVLELVATGATNKQIAANLDVGAGTVKWHMYNMFQKLGVETRTEAVVAARELGLVS